MSTREPYPLTTSIHIIGSSVFGLSSALHLARAGYTNITVFDRSPTLPSPYAASHDLNKIIRAEYGADHAEDDFYTELALEAIGAWQSDEWKECFRQVGYLRLAKSESKQRGIVGDMVYFSLAGKADEKGKRRWFPEGSFRGVTSKRDLEDVVPRLDGKLDGQIWKGYLNTHAGYALASEAIKLAYRKCCELGVKFVLGEDGHIVELLRDAAHPGTISGIASANGTRHMHPSGSPSLTIIAMGAHVGKLLPSLRSRVTAKAWSVAHLELNKVEALALQNVPVVNLSEIGFWMEPLRLTVDGDGEERFTLPSKDDPEDAVYLLKLACHGGGWTAFNQEQDSRYSVPPNQPTKTIPAEDEAQLRELVKTSLPDAFHTRLFVRKSICWCADTADSDYCFDFVPEYDNVILAGADSGHAFKMLPVIGKAVVDVVQQRKQIVKRWKWKEAPKDLIEGVSWRPGEVRDIGSAFTRDDLVKDSHL